MCAQTLRFNFAPTSFVTPNAAVQGRAGNAHAKHDDAFRRVPWNRLFGVI